MKRALLFFFATIIGFSVNAQANNDEPDIFRSTFGKGRSVIVNELIPLDDIKDAQFNAVYDQYTNEQTVLAEKKYSLLESYVNNYMI